VSEEDAPFFEDALRHAGAKLSKVSDPTCTIKVLISLDDHLMSAVMAVDKAAFRSELRYNEAELRGRVGKEGFTAIIAQCAEKPLGFIFGYDDLEVERGFYCDTLASSIEGIGVGSTLFTLMLIYCYDSGYKFLSLHTEDFDEKGRQFRRFYEAMGVEYLHTDPKDGVHMRVRLDPQRLNENYRKFILGERSRIDSTTSSNPSIS